MYNNYNIKKNKDNNKIYFVEKLWQKKTLTTLIFPK